MLTELEKNLGDGLKKLIEKEFRKPIEKFEPLEKTEVFFVVYKTMALLLQRDFDILTELQIVEITQDKSKELKENVFPNNLSSQNTQPNS